MEDTQGRSAVSDKMWRRWTLRAVTIFGGLMAATLVAILFIDPYDSGRFPALGIKGESLFFQRYGNIGLARAPRFNSAIFGNSHGQILNPRTLSQATGLKFVQLTVPGANPREQITMMHWFVSHHDKVAAMVLALDERWCSHNPALPLATFFPFGLYRGNLEYIANMVSTRAVRDAYERIMFGLGRRPSADPDGYEDYEAGKTRDFHLEPPPLKPGPATAVRLTDEAKLYYPALDLLDGVLRNVQADTRIVIVLPPQFATRVAPNDSEEINDCKRAMYRRVQGRAGGGFVDFLLQSPITRNPDNFWDDEHYTSEIGKLIEKEIAAKLNAGRAR